MMIQFEEALQKIIQCSESLGIEKAPLTECLGYTIAESVTATCDSPSFDNSAMDGYGVRVKDLENASKANPVALKLQGTVQAGDYSEAALEADASFKILTGAPIPSGVEAVVMKEYCSQINGQVLISNPTKLHENIRFKGEEFKKDQEVITLGTNITPPVVGLLANLGLNCVRVYRKPRVSIIVTGNELVAPGIPLKAGQIYDSNSYALLAALNDMGITDCSVYYAADTKEETQMKFREAIARHDVVITLGGISVGEYDFVKEVVEEEGIETVFWQIAIKPGKPVYFGRLKIQTENKLVFGLPGNPVSALVTFYQLVRPALHKIMGIQDQLQLTTAILQEPLRKRSGRLEFVRGFFKKENGSFMVKPTTGQSSHMLSGLAFANCLIHFPEDRTSLNQGDEVSIDLLQWNQVG